MNKNISLCRSLVFSTVAVAAGLLCPVSGHSQTAGDACTAGQLSGPDALGRNLICSGGVFVAATGYGIGSQWTTNGTDIYYNDGNVGIGTTAPSSTLHVWGGTKFGNTLSTPSFNDHTVILTDGGTAFEGGLLLTNSDNASAGNSSVKLSGSFGAAAGNADFVIGLVNNDAPNTFVRQWLYGDGGTGKVGIGTTSPNAGLSVVGSGVGNYRVLELLNTTVSGTDKGGLILGSRKDMGAIPFTGLGTWDNGSGRQIFIGGGAWSTPDATDIRFYTAFGYNETNNTGVERMRINSLGNVGIGTGSPNATLNISGSLMVSTSAQVASNPSLYVRTNGNVGIGTASPNQGKLEVKGGTVCVDTNSDDNASSCIANESDARLKTNVKPLAGALDKVMRLRGVSFDWKVSDTEILKHYPLISRFAAKPHSIGLIAQEVQQVVPEAIEAETVGDGEMQYLQLDYAKLMPVALEAIKELKVANDNQAAQLRDLRAEFDAYTRTHP